jgi:hypothetical protein
VEISHPDRGEMEMVEGEGDQSEYIIILLVVVFNNT